MPESSPFPLVNLQLVADARQSLAALLLRQYPPEPQRLLEVFTLPGLAQTLGKLPCLLPLDDPALLSEECAAALPVQNLVLLFPSASASAAAIEPLRARGFALSFASLTSGVDSRAHFTQLKQMGTQWFCGTWYLDVEQHASADQGSARALMLRLLQLVAADAETSEIERVFKRDSQLSYQLLKLVNSVAMGLPHKISNFRQAIVILGQRQLQRWVQLLLFAQQQGDGQGALLQAATVMRARLLELLCTGRGADSALPDQAFMTGMFSRLDVLFGQPLEQIITPLNLADATVAALLRGEGKLGALLRIVEAAERDDGEALDSALSQAGVTRQDFALAQFRACRWMLDVAQENGDG